MKNDGGPAFPCAFEIPASEHYEGGIQSDPGMSLRDYFAAAALPGVVAEFGVSAEGRAKRCYEYADAMLIERNKS